MLTRSIIFLNAEAFEAARYMVKNHEIFNQCNIVSHERTYPNDPRSPHITMTVSGREKDLHALNAMSQMAAKVAVWKGDRNQQVMLVNHQVIEVKRREYESGRYTNDILLNGVVHSPAVGDVLLQEVLGKTITYARTLK